MLNYAGIDLRNLNAPNNPVATSSSAISLSIGADVPPGGGGGVDGGGGGP